MDLGIALLNQRLFLSMSNDSLVYGVRFMNVIIGFCDIRECLIVFVKYI